MSDECRAVVESDCCTEWQVGDLLLAYLEQLSVEYLFGVPGGGIEPLYNALARSERAGGIRAVVSRHESGAAFMADGYYRQSGRLAVCCATTGPGATNLITGVASAYENQIPMLVLTGQTALSNFGRGALQESSCTGINTTGMFQHCTRYNSLVSHIDQFERKLASAIMTAFQPPFGPVHLSLPLDLLRQAAPVSKPSYNLLPLLKPQVSIDPAAIAALAERLESSKGTVFLLGEGSAEAMEEISLLAHRLGIWLVATPHAKGLINHNHPRFCGIYGFAGHESAEQLLQNDTIDTVVVIGSALSEWASNGWDSSVMGERLIHVESVPSHLTRSPMAGLHVHGNIRQIFLYLLTHYRDRGPARRADPAMRSPYLRQIPPMELAGSEEHGVKPQWLMRKLSDLLPPGSVFLADSGNSIAWAIHHFHPPERRLVVRHNHKTLFRGALEFASMGWAIGAAVGSAMACRHGETVVCVTGDGSWLMSGQEITVAVQNSLTVVFIILNDQALGMVRHGQRLGGAESIGYELPKVNYAECARAMGADGFEIHSPAHLLELDFQAICSRSGPTLLDVHVDPDEVPPIGSRLKVLGGGLP